MSASYSIAYPPMTQAQIDSAEVRGDLVLIELEVEDSVWRVPLNPEKEKTEGMLRGRVLKCGPEVDAVAPGTVVQCWQYFRERGSDKMRVPGSGRLVAFVPEQNIQVEFST